MPQQQQQKLNCFEWQNQVSDYLDGALEADDAARAEEHLKSCDACGERHKHYRTILSSIASQPRSTLPVPIRRSPFTTPLPRIDANRLWSRARWEQIPWYFRTGIEGAAIVFMILLGISVGPKLRSIYEKGVEQSLSEFTQSFHDHEKESVAELDAEAVPLARGKTPAAEQDEFMSEGEGEGASDTSETADEGEIRVGGSEIWRFIIKTSSPHEVRPRIVQLLTELKVPADTVGLGGIEAPGGIQFDLLVPQTVVAPLKKQLQALAPKAPAELADTPAGETFTWYKNRSKTRLPEKKTRIVIWLSQM